VNKVKHLKVGGLFYVKQEKKESLKQFLGHFCEFFVQIAQPNERIFVDAFVKGLQV